MACEEFVDVLVDSEMLWTVVDEEDDAPLVPCETY
jgi:hypothetical protein